MFDRAGRAQVGLRAEERKRDDKFYREAQRGEYRADEGNEAFFIVRRLLSVLGKDHQIFESLEAIKDKSMTDMLGKVKKGRKTGELNIAHVGSLKNGEKYDNWGTW